MKYIIFKNGTKEKVLKDSGRYYVCESAQFKKTNPFIEKITETKKKKDTENHTSNLGAEE